MSYFILVNYVNWNNLNFKLESETKIKIMLYLTKT